LKHPTSRPVRALAAAALLAFAGGDATAQDYSAFTGPQLFAKFCASCHGMQGRGDGPVAPSLKIDVPDLTRLIRRPGAEFPLEQVRRIVDGRDVFAAHGAHRMPVWGYEFATATVSEPDAGAAGAAVLVNRLVDYLRTIQHYDAPPPPAVPIAPAPPATGTKTR
jgi:mono/diheme cytochrome c family protein